jgi:hypothetical protein
VDRLHRPVRWRRAGLRDARHRRRAAAADLLPGARSHAAALGLRQPGLRLDQRRQAHHLPLAARRLVQRFQPAVHRSMDGGPAEPLPMPNSGAGSFSPAGNRKIVYSPQARDFRTEKRYSGGTANQLYIFDVETHEARKISEGERASRDPMWVATASTSIPTSDGHFNLYAYDVASGKTSQLTTNKTYDLRWPSSDRESRIVLRAERRAADFDVKSHKITPISITVPSDEVARRPSRVSAAQPDRTVRTQSQGRARAVRGARRYLHRAHRERAGAQPDRQFGRARKMARMVAGRIENRLHFR